jgi:hypothetical protein
MLPGKLVIQAIPYRNFKEKLDITKKYFNKRCTITENFVIVEE